MIKFLYSKHVRMAILLWMIPVFANGQYSRQYDGPDDPAGDDAYFRSGHLNGNRMYFYFHNNSSITDTGHDQAIWNRWPDTYEGSTLVHGIVAVITARVHIDGDSTPVDDMDEIRNRNDLKTLYFAQQGFRNREDRDPTGTFGWGFKPVYGYLNELAESPAMSNNPETWPPQGWPAPGDEVKWPGEWNGRFGRGVLKANLESFFVLNDAQDQENLGPEDSVRYYPRPGVKIGDKRPDKVYVQKGLPWGGIGLRMEVRTFQWNNPQAQDALFYEYTVANISEYNLPEVNFGYYCHPWVGQDWGMTGDDFLFFDKKLDMAYNWDRDGIGTGGIPSPVFGMAYLESPAAPFDGIDNDEDGLTDEKRDNAAVQKVGPYEGITSLPDFLEYYHYTESMLREHWDADEDQDWQDGHDANGNGQYDADENPGDDLGLDGVGPGELNYRSPDADGTECNHRPDYLEGVGCEPNFAATDIAESDMLGLTSYHTYDHQNAPAIHEDDERYFLTFADATYDPFQDKPGAWVTLFATGTFPLYKGRTERISIAIVGSYDPLESLNGSDHRAPSLWRKKEVVQIIYESDYQFAQPPRQPTLTATAMDGKVILTWDDAADKLTREPLLQNQNDFEGYRLYKATDKKFSDAMVVTDGRGNPLLKRPIFQCDLKDNISGFADFGVWEGTAYYLGDDTGIQHYFVDENVENGRTYYYGLAAYDFGIRDLGSGVTPTENETIIELDEAEEILFHGRNVAVVTPHQQAAGYVPSQIRVLDQSFPESLGSVQPRILQPDSLKPGHIYLVRFHVDTVFKSSRFENALRYTTNGYEVYDITSGPEIPVHIRYQNSADGRNAPLKIEWIDSLSSYAMPVREPLETDQFDGLNLKLQLNHLTADSALIDFTSSGWKAGNLSGQVRMNILPNAVNIAVTPWTYEIVWGEPGVYTTQTRTLTRVKDENEVKIDQEWLSKYQSFDFFVRRTTFPDTAGNPLILDLVAWDYDSSGTFDIRRDRVIAGMADNKGAFTSTCFVIDFEEGSEMPLPNDVYRLNFKRPLHGTDTYTFKVLGPGGLDHAAVRQAMDSIQVVPNPYVATNSMEPAVANYRLNQRRRVLFTHLPARCSIKIFTASGVLVNELDVQNSADNGTAFWDLASKEGLEVSAGIYVFHVRARETGDEKIGKFAVIK